MSNLALHENDKKTFFSRDLFIIRAVIKACERVTFCVLKAKGGLDLGAERLRTQRTFRVLLRAIRLNRIFLFAPRNIPLFETLGTFSVTKIFSFNQRFIFFKTGENLENAKPAYTCFPHTNSHARILFCVGVGLLPVAYPRVSCIGSCCWPQWNTTRTFFDWSQQTAPPVGFVLVACYLRRLWQDCTLSKLITNNRDNTKNF